MQSISRLRIRVEGKPSHLTSGRVVDPNHHAVDSLGPELLAHNVSCLLLSLVAGSRRLEAMVGETEQVFDDGSWLLLGQVMAAVLDLDGVAHVGRDLAPDLRHRLAGQVTPISPQQRNRHRHPHARGTLRAVARHVDLVGGAVVLERGAHRAGLEERATVLAVRAVGVQPVEKFGARPKNRSR